MGYHMHPKSHLMSTNHHGTGLNHINWQFKELYHVRAASRDLEAFSSPFLWAVPGADVFLFQGPTKNRDDE